MTSVKITAHLETPIIGDLYPLDGPLAWAYVQRATASGQHLEPITDDHCPDMPLPLEKWHENNLWGWKISAPQYSGEPHHTAVEIRRKPATTAMMRYTTDREHHHGLGPMKARNVTLAAQIHRTIEWYAEATDIDELQNLLAHITHLGARHRNGFGKVTKWRIDETKTPQWRNRPMPAQSGRLMRVRAPYWHPTERTPCA